MAEPAVLDPLVWRAEEVARLLAVSRDVVYRLMDSGELASFRLGRRRVVAKRALDRFLEERAQ